MATLQPIGQEIGEFPIDLTRIRVLEYFEGDRLVEYRSAGKDPFFKIWMDTDANFTRWMYLRLTDSDVARFLHASLSLRDVILGARDGHVYVVDKHGSHTQRVSFVRVAQIPHKDLPLEESFYDSSLTPECGPFDGPAEQVIMLDGAWDGDTLAKLERRYIQVYSFNALFASGSVKDIGWIENRLSNYVFAGSGWSHVNAVDTIVACVPREDKPAFDSIQLSSPGVVKYRVDSRCATHVRDALKSLRERGEEVELRYHGLHQQLTEINRAAREQEFTPDEMASFLSAPNPGIKQAAIALADALGIDKDRIWSVGGADINSAEMVSGYYRRILELFEHEVAGRAVVV